MNKLNLALIVSGMFFLFSFFTFQGAKSIGINGAPSSDTPQGIAHDLVEVGAFVPDGHGGYIITEKGMDELNPHWRENPEIVKNNPWKNSGNPNGQPASSAANNSNAPAPVKEYPHDYPEINAEALEALSHFTNDGVPESAYLNINTDSKENKISGNILNLSKTEKEDIKISFVSGNEMKYEWVFREWESDDDFEMNLASAFDKDENSEYEDTYNLVFAQEGTLSGNNVTYRVNTGVSENTAFIYRKNGEDFEEIYKGKTDVDGVLELHPDELGSYVVSFTDIITKKEAEKAEADRLAKEEAERQASIEAAEAAAKEEVTESVIEEPSVATESVDNVTKKTANDYSFYIVLPVFIVAGLALIIGVLALVKLRKG